MEQQEHKLGSTKIPTLLLQMSLPIMISMLVQALYNIVDSMYVSRYSDDAFTAVSLVFPIQILLIAVATGTGVGANSLLSRRLGEKNQKEVNSVAVHSLLLAIFSALVFALFGFFGANAFIRMFSSDATVISMGHDYLFICTVFSFGLFLQIACERLMQACGKSMYSMITQGLGAIINIILDPILIFGLAGFPALGIKGAAIATVVGQIIAMLVGLLIVHRKVTDIHLNIRGFRPNYKIIKEIYVVGIPSILLQSLSSVMTMGLNAMLTPISIISVRVLSVYFKLQSFIFMPVFGLTSGMIPIVAFNLGARKKERIMQTIKLSIIAACSIMLLGTVLLQLFPAQLIGIFSKEQELITQGIVSLRIISSSFVLAGVAIVLTSVFQAVGNGIFSLIMSFVRQIVILLPVAFILSRFLGSTGVWLAFLVAEFVSTAMALYFFKIVNKKVLDSL